MHILDRFTACSPDGGVKLVSRELRTQQHLGIQTPMVSLYFRTTLNEGIKAFAAAGGDANHIVECHERQSGDEPPTRELSPPFIWF